MVVELIGGLVLACYCDRYIENLIYSILHFHAIDHVWTLINDDFKAMSNGRNLYHQSALSLINTYSVNCNNA